MLAQCADDAERVNAWHHQKESLHALFDQTLEEAVPERLLRATQRQ